MDSLSRVCANRATGLLRGHRSPGEARAGRRRGGPMDESSLANSTIQRRSPREECAGRMDEWTTTQTTRQSTTVHDSSMEVSGSGSRRDRPTALDRPIATTDRPPRPRRPTASTALDRPRPPSRRVEWTTEGSIEGAQCATDGRTDGRNGPNGRNGRTDRTNERTERSLARVRSRVSSTAARARESERFEIRAAVIRAFIHSFIRSSSGDERARA